MLPGRCCPRHCPFRWSKRSLSPSCSLSHSLSTTLYSHTGWHVWMKQVCTNHPLSTAQAAATAALAQLQRCSLTSPLSSPGGDSHLPAPIHPSGTSRVERWTNNNAFRSSAVKWEAFRVFGSVVWQCLSPQCLKGFQHALIHYMTALSLDLWVTSPECQGWTGSPRPIVHHCAKAHQCT